MTDTIVFSGPSLSHQEGKSILPEACFHDPIKCGDIIKVTRLNPKRLVIIDGYFEQTGSVWHKEILFALSKGICVYGSSSMGALRAAELDQFGMKGFGKIYQAYANGLMDDDEVCLVHESDFQNRIPALCNIKLTLERALKLNLVSKSAKDAYIAKFKSLPYFERDFTGLINDHKLKAWCADNLIDQKKIDAIDLLNHLKQTDITPQPKTEFVATLYFHKIYREMIVSPFAKPYPWLPQREIALINLSKQPGFNAITRYAKLLHLAHDLDIQPIEANINWLNYLAIYDPTSIQHHHRMCANLLEPIAAKMTTLGLNINAKHQQLFANKFRRRLNLNSIEDTQTWLKESGLNDLEGYSKFVAYMCVLDILIEEHNGHLLGAELSTNITDWIFLAQAALSAEPMAQT